MRFRNEEPVAPAEPKLEQQPSAVFEQDIARPVLPASFSPIRRLWNRLWPSLSFLFQTEVHVYAFAVAANMLMSFFPFLVAIISLCRSVLHWRAAVDVLFKTLNDYFPEGFGVPFRSYLTVAASHPFSWISVLLLLFTANGIFVPLEVALNRIWRVNQNRSFLRNQIISLTLIFGCGMLVLANVSFTTINAQFLSARFGSSQWVAQWESLILRIAALPLTMVLIFLIYWVLPNAKIPVRRIVPASIVVSLLLEIAKYLNVLTWPWLRDKLRNEVPPFVQSISIILWSFFATLIVLAGAEWSARVTVKQIKEVRA